MGAKHKKTRKEKIIADYRHQVYSLENKNISSSVNINSAKISRNDEHSYSYVLHDISKTLVITLTLIGLQIILFFLVKKHIISLSIVSY